MAKDNENKIVGAMWKKESKGGMKYFSLVLDGKDDDDKKQYAAFKVKQKKSDKSPDYTIIESKPFDKKKKKPADDDDEDEDTEVEEDDSEEDW